MNASIATETQRPGSLQGLVGASGICRPKRNLKYTLDISAYVVEHGRMMKTQNGNHKPATATPGPWTVGPYVENDYEPAYFPVERDERDENGFVKDVRPLIAKSTYGATVEDKLANARLLAAAPQLLAALKAMQKRLRDGYADHKLDWTETDSNVYEQASVAVAEAEGERE